MKLRIKAFVKTSTNDLFPKVLACLEACEREDLHGYAEGTYVQFKALPLDQVFERIGWNESPASYVENYGPAGIDAAIKLTQDGAWGEAIIHFAQSYETWSSDPKAEELKQAILSVDWEMCDS